MQRVTEFVEHRRHVIKAEQRRLARTRLREVAHVYYDRLGAQQVALIDKAVLPGAAVFVRALKIVCVEKCERLAVRIKDFKDAHVWMVNRQVFSLFERNAVKLVRRKENAVVQDML